MRWLLVVPALVIALSGCDNRSVMGCTSTGGCETTTPSSSATALHAIETGLKAAGFTKEGQTNNWRREDDTVHLTPEISSSFVVVSFPEGKVHCDSIFIAPTMPEPVARINDLKAMTHLQALGEKGCDAA